MDDRGAAAHGTMTHIEDPGDVRRLVRRRIRHLLDDGQKTLDLRALSLLLALDVQLALEVYESAWSAKTAKTVATVHMLTVGILKEGGHAVAQERVGAAWAEYLDRMDGRQPSVQLIDTPPEALAEAAARAVPEVMKTMAALERAATDAVDGAVAKRAAKRTAGAP